MALIQRNGIYWIDLTLNGKRHRVSTKTKDKALAGKLHSVFERDLWLGVHKPEKPIVTLQTAFDLVYKLHWSKTKSHETVVHNWKTVCLLLGNNTPITEITSDKLHSMATSMSSNGLTQATINRKLALVSKLLHFHKDLGNLDSIPTIPFQKETSKRIRVISESEFTELTKELRQTTKPDYLLMADLVTCLMDTGCRLSELLTLSSDDVNLNHRLIHLWDTKTSSSRSQPMTERVYRILVHLVKLKAALRPGERIFPLSKDRAEDIWNWAKKRIGLSHDSGFVIHALRHTTASRLIQSGANLLEVKEYLGHKTIATTQRYAHLAPDAMTKMTLLLQSTTKDKHKD